MQIPHGALLVGISLGGLVAAKLQELGRNDLKVVAISSPTWADNVVLEAQQEQRLAFYSSQGSVIAPFLHPHAAGHVAMPAFLTNVNVWMMEIFLALLFESDSHSDTANLLTSTSISINN
jgi:pimeloyl-ACP methyl ester carboxylesterase